MFVEEACVQLRLWIKIVVAKIRMFRTSGAGVPVPTRIVDNAS